ncbi:hypothetical protein [Rheinheimera gaetbuli]
MEYSPISEKQAIAMLNEWKEAGHDLPSLAKFKKGESATVIIALIPGYRCNQWYQIGKTYAGYSEAMTSIGKLLDRTNVT